MYWQSLFFSFRGRINRGKFWLATLVFFAAALGPALVGLVAGDTVAFQAVSALIDLAIFVAGLAVAIKRLHDRDKSAWWLLFFYFGPGLFIILGGFIMWASAGAVGMTLDGAQLALRLCLLGGFALGIWGLVEIGFLPGTVGYNRFGADPLGRNRRLARI
jgi:uncharacterized membrane protein YhaH (DUF805 family)